MFRLLTALGLLLIAPACPGGGHDPDGGDPAPTTVVIGQGDDEGQGFTSLEDGGEALLHYGAQGGFHVFFAAEVTGFIERRVTFEIRAYRDDLEEGRAVSEMRRALDLEPSDGAGALVTAQAERVILCPSPTGIGADGKPYRLWVTVEGDSGHTAHAEVDVTTVCPTGDARCPAICAGE
jgi:hypothetical protein